MPFRSAEANTAASGTTRNKPRNASATPVSSQRMAGRSVVTAAAARVAEVMSGSQGFPATRAVLEAVDQQQKHERGDQHHHRDGGSTCVVVLLQLGDDQERGDL